MDLFLLDNWFLWQAIMLSGFLLNSCLSGSWAQCYHIRSVQCTILSYLFSGGFLPWVYRWMTQGIVRINYSTACAPPAWSRRWDL
jgi:hypothetical protein